MGSTFDGDVTGGRFRQLLPIELGGIALIVASSLNLNQSIQVT